MPSFIPCPGSGQPATGLERYPSRPDGLGMTRAKTFGQCQACGRVVMAYGLAVSIKVTRHKAKVSADAPADSHHPQWCSERCPCKQGATT